MAEGRFRGRSALVTGAAQGIGRAIAERLTGEWTAFAGRVQAMGEIFGTDDVSSIIAISYDDAFGIADGSYGSAAEVLGGYGETLVAMADSYERIEESNNGLFAKLY